jgi:hypothetical protein
MINKREGNKEEEKVKSIERLRTIIGKHVKEEVLQFHLQLHRYNPWWAANGFFIATFASPIMNNNTNGNIHKIGGVKLTIGLEMRPQGKYLYFLKGDLV